MAKFLFTPESIERSEVPAKGHRIDYDDGPVRGLALQTTYAGARRFLLVYVAKASGRERRMVLGEYGKAPRLSLSAARKIAAEKRALVELGGDPWLEAKQTRAEAEAKHAKSGATFGNLLTAYVEALRRAKQASAEGVNRELVSTIQKPHPRLWKKPAAEVTLDDLVAILNTLTRAKKWRQAEKTRSYLRAAYTMAAAARGNASTADLFADFADVPNIGRDLATVERPKLDDDQEAAAKRALTVAELSAYWQRIKRMDAPVGAILRFHLLTGAQRCAQLARLQARHIDPDAHTITLMDAKGRRKKAREHTIPLIPDALAALEAMRGDAGPYVFTADGGASGAGFHAVRRYMQQVAADMVAAEEVESLFTPGEIRITVETRLAAAGVPMEVRAQLQSHGLGGVQHRHYDKHDYLAEKRSALVKLRKLLEPAGESGNVTPIRRKAG